MSVSRDFPYLCPKPDLQYPVPIIHVPDIKLFQNYLPKSLEIPEARISLVTSSPREICVNIFSTVYIHSPTAPHPLIRINKQASKEATRSMSSGVLFTLTAFRIIMHHRAWRAVQFCESPSIFLSTVINYNLMAKTRSHRQQWCRTPTTQQFRLLSCGGWSKLLRRCCCSVGCRWWRWSDPQPSVGHPWKKMPRVCNKEAKKRVVPLLYSSSSHSSSPNKVWRPGRF